MGLKNLAIGPIHSLEDAERAIRDIEMHLNSMFPEDPPVAGVSLLVLNSDGVIELWSLVSAGGCTITQDAANKQFTVSVP